MSGNISTYINPHLKLLMPKLAYTGDIDIPNLWVISTVLMIMWEEDIVNPPIHHLTCVIVPCPSVKNNLVNPEDLH